MILKKHICSILQSNAILIACGRHKKAVVVDPGYKSLSWIRKELLEHHLTLEKTLLTHFHFDHVFEADKVRNEFGAAICIHAEDAKALQEPQMDLVAGIQADVLLSDNEKIAIGNIEIKVLHTPGHTKGSVCFYLEKEKILLSGDTLFKGTIGRVGARDELMWSSLKRLSLLPADTRVIPGHGEDTSIGKEVFLSSPREFFSR